jgi:hypothetical protein
MKRNFDDPQYKQWRADVRKRDGATCVWPNCNSRKRIHAHHIYPWTQFPHLRYLVDNGCCLCYTHHKLVNTNELIYAPLFLSIIKQSKIAQKPQKTRKPPRKTRPSNKRKKL